MEDPPESSVFVAEVPFDVRYRSACLKRYMRNAMDMKHIFTQVIPPDNESLKSMDEEGLARLKEFSKFLSHCIEKQEESVTTETVICKDDTKDITEDKSDKTDEKDNSNGEGSSAEPPPKKAKRERGASEAEFRKKIIEFSNEDDEDLVSVTRERYVQ